MHVGDDPGAVIGNRARLASTLKIDTAALTFAEQVHGAVVTRIVPEMKGAGAVSVADAVRSTDALLTTEADTCLTILTADCLPIILADPKHRIVSVVHAGWRGTFDRIAKNAVEAMVGAGAGLAEIQARLGPHIAGGCYEVGEELYRQFAKRFSLPAVVNGYYLDLAALNTAALIEAGVPAENIEAMDVCTHCRGDLFYSWRRDGVTGRQAALAALTDLNLPAL